MNSLEDKLEDLARRVRRLQVVSSALAMALAGTLFMAQAPLVRKVDSFTVGELRADKIVVSSDEYATHIRPGVVSLEHEVENRDQRGSVGLAVSSLEGGGTQAQLRLSSGQTTLTLQANAKKDASLRGDAPKPATPFVLTTRPVAEK